jgi:hypothetical protein
MAQVLNPRGSSSSEQIYLSGGTALSRFHFDHRFSEDLDFFFDGSRFPEEEFNAFGREAIRKLTAKLGRVGVGIGGLPSAPLPRVRELPRPPARPLRLRPGKPWGHRPGPSPHDGRARGVRPPPQGGHRRVRRLGRRRSQDRRRGRVDTSSHHHGTARTLEQKAFPEYKPEGTT